MNPEIRTPCLNFQLDPLVSLREWVAWFTSNFFSSFSWLFSAKRACFAYTSIFFLLFTLYSFDSGWLASYLFHFLLLPLLALHCDWIRENFYFLRKGTIFSQKVWLKKITERISVFMTNISFKLAFIYRNKIKKIQGQFTLKSTTQQLFLMRK